MKILQILFIGIFCLFVFAGSISAALDCTPTGKDKDSIECKFGTISPPPAIKDFIGIDPTGAGGISKFLTNLVALIYSLATIVLIFMILWGAFDWMTSGGEKEKLESARNKIISAIIGIMLFAIAFAIIQLLGTFTGFKFFSRPEIPGVLQRRQPDTSCFREYDRCLDQAGGADRASQAEQDKCLQTHDECVRTTP